MSQIASGSHFESSEIQTFLQRMTPKIKDLSQISFARAISPLFLDWLLIALTIFFASRASGLGIYLASLIIIASRQHALLVMVHEGAHYRLANKKMTNDFLSNLFAAYPIFFCTNGYRANHLAHHKFLNSESDPDWARKIHLPEWQFPQSPLQFLGTMLKVFMTSWYKMILLFWNLSGISRKATWRDSDKRRLVFAKILFYGVLAGLLYLTHTANVFFFYWIVPYLTLMPLIERTRSISEHFGLPYTNDFTDTRNIISSPLEAFLIGAHNIRYHLDHHLFPSVPQYNLPALHSRLIREPLYLHEAHLNDSYFGGKKSVLRDILKTSPKRNDVT